MADMGRARTKCALLKANTVAIWACATPGSVLLIRFESVAKMAILLLQLPKCWDHRPCNSVLSF